MLLPRARACARKLSLRCGLSRSPMWLVGPGASSETSTSSLSRSIVSSSSERINLNEKRLSSTRNASHRLFGCRTSHFVPRKIALRLYRFHACRSKIAAHFEFQSQPEPPFFIAMAMRRAVGTCTRFHRAAERCREVHMTRGSPIFFPWLPSSPWRDRDPFECPL